MDDCNWLSRRGLKGRVAGMKKREGTGSKVCIAVWFFIACVLHLIIGGIQLERMNNADKMNEDFGNTNIYINLFGAEAYDSCNFPSFSVPLGDEFEVGLINSEILTYCGDDTACY